VTFLPRLLSGSFDSAARLLLTFESEQLRRGWGARSATFASWGLSLTFFVLLVLSRQAGAALPSQSVVRSLETASWYIPLLVLWECGARTGAKAPTALSLLAMRGVPSQTISVAAFVALTGRLSLLLLPPGAVLAGMALVFARTGIELGVGAALVVWTALYAVALSACLATLTAVSRQLWPQHVRWALFLLVLVPHGLRQIWGAVPSLPAVADGMLAIVPQIIGGRW
jgi:hypothetical protein